MSNKAFFDWFPFAFDPECDGMALTAWNAATERATAIERERCAVVCETLKIKALRLQTGQDDDLSNVILRQVAHSGAGFCAEIIRQGGPS